MNKIFLMGRLTRNPEVRYSQGENEMAIARYTLAVNRRFVKDGEQEADFVRCVAFGTSAEFAEKWFRQGTKIVIVGRIQTGSYINQDGVKVYTTEVVVEEQDFAGSKKQENTDESGENNSLKSPAEEEKSSHEDEQNQMEDENEEENENE